MSESKIAYIVSMVTGLEAFIYREVEELTGKGIPIVFFATKFKEGDIYASKPEWPTFYLSHAALVLRLPLLLIRSLIYPKLLLESLRLNSLIDLLFALHFAPLMRKVGVKQIHCHFGDHKLFIGYYCKKLTGLPLSVTIHAHEFYTNPNPELFKKAIKYCDMMFPIAERWRQRLHDEYGVPEDRLNLNRLFVNNSSYVPSTSLKILSVGRFTERKGFQVLMDAAKQLTDLDVSFWFVGFGPLDLLDMAKVYGISDRVIVFNKMDQQQLRAIYQTADIFCLPSITTEAEGAEGIPVVLMEAMACGLPIVATRCGAVDEIVEEFLVDERSPDQLAKAIRKLVKDPILRQQQGKRNRKIVEEKYSIKNLERFAENLLSVCEKI